VSLKKRSPGDRVEGQDTLVGVVRLTGEGDRPVDVSVGEALWQDRVISDATVRRVTDVDHEIWKSLRPETLLPTFGEVPLAFEAPERGVCRVGKRESNRASIVAEFELDGDGLGLVVGDPGLLESCVG